MSKNQDQESIDKIKQQLDEFTKEYNPKHSIVVSLEENTRVIKFDDQKIIIYPVEEFLSDLWNGLLF